MTLLKQSTAYTRTFFLVSSTDHLSAKTGATATVNLSKAGGSFAAAGGSVAEIANGWYKVSLNTTDTNTLGDLAFHITASGADDTDFVDQVVSFDTQDANALGLARLDAAISSRMATFTLPANFTSLAIDGSGRVDLSKWLGAAPNALISGRVDANAQVVGDKTGYTVSTVSDKTGYSLAASGLDAISVTDPGSPGSHTTIPKMVVALWRWFYKKTTLTSSQLKTYQDDGSTVNGTASVSDDGTTQTKGALS